MNSVERIEWGVTRDGRPVGRWQLSNERQQIQVAELGARWLGWRVSQHDLLLGLADVPAIERDTCFIGAVVGRYANRIANSQFTLDGQTYQLPPNEGSKMLHGGAGGLWSHVWQGTAVEVDGYPAVRFTTSSPAGDQGFPANLELQATYVLGENWVRLDYRANSDARTILNVTNHAYFNLAGGGDVLGHRVQVAAHDVVAVDEQSLPTGEFWPVAGTDFDLRTPRSVGQQCASTDPRIASQRGLDHCYVLDAQSEVAAQLSFGELTVEVLTDQPGLQVYCGQWLSGDWGPFAGVCLETQHFPDSPNHPEFPSTVVEAGVEWRSSTTYRLA